MDMGCDPWTRDEKVCFEDLIDCLGSKAKQIALRQPMPPIEVEAKVLKKPPLPKINYTPSGKYMDVREDFDRKIAEIRKTHKRKFHRKEIKKLKSRKKITLKKIRNDEIGPVKMEEYRAAARLVVEWESKTQMLTQAAAKKNAQNLAKYKSQMIAYERSRKTKNPDALRIVINLRKEYEGSIHDTIQCPVQKLPWKFLERDALSEDVICPN